MTPLHYSRAVHGTKKVCAGNRNRCGAMLLSTSTECSAFRKSAFPEYLSSPAHLVVPIDLSIFEVTFWYVSAGEIPCSYVGRRKMKFIAQKRVKIASYLRGLASFCACVTSIGSKQKRSGNMPADASVISMSGKTKYASSRTTTAYKIYRNRNTENSE